MSPIVEREELLAELVRGIHTVAVVGIKDGVKDPDAPAYSIPKLLADTGHTVIGVNPKVPKALGQATLASLAQLPAGVDALDVFRRSEVLPELADQVLALPAERRPRIVWLQSGIRHDAAAERLSAAGITVVQDRCLGVYSRRYR